MSSIPDFRRAKATTHENVEVTTNESTSTDVNNVFGSDMTTDAETDAETGTIAAREKSIQKELIKNLEEEYVEINSYREKLMINIANYGKILNQIDFGSVEDENPSEGVSALYDRLEEHKRRMLLVISDNHMDIKSSIKAIILKQVLNKRAVYIIIRGILAKTIMSFISNFSTVKAATKKNTKNSNDEIEVDVFESDLTTDTETEAEGETVAAKELSPQKEIFEKLKEEYTEINSYRERLKTNIDNYAKLLRQIDFGSLEDTNPSEFLENVYDCLEEHKTRMLEIIGDDNMAIKTSLKEIILKQILNKRAFHVEEDNKTDGHFNENWHLALNKIILNPKIKVRDHENKITTVGENLSDNNNSNKCQNCGNYKEYSGSCSYCNCKNAGVVLHTHPFNKKLLAVLYTQINSLNNEVNNDINIPIYCEYDCSSWQEKLFTLFSKENIQRYKFPEARKLQ
ncbi:hypothetical protein B5S31_g1005 [[Candida] boidinii]|nr:hypothetical protein B5S31_g1005 [[Candida] boidinii]